MRKKFIIIILLIFSSISLAQGDPKIEIQYITYPSPGVVELTIVNIGTEPITDVEFYVDGKRVKTSEGLSPPGDAFITELHLSPGKHLIEAKTPEGAYDSVNVTIGEYTTTTIEREKEKYEISERDLIYIGVVIVIIIVGITFEVLRKRK